ncbi:MAG: single-stranded DNA-binding protein, partial [Spirochaetaceae bacterium]|nr:single-stranded DNA-binding protein [Spirochaetaceae bacterium]
TRRRARRPARWCWRRTAPNKDPERQGERIEEVSFFETTTWGKLATVCAEHLHKGRGVRVVGRLKQERWEDDAGNARAKVVVIAEQVEFQPVRHRPREAEPAAAAS